MQNRTEDLRGNEALGPADADPDSLQLLLNKQKEISFDMKTANKQNLAQLNQMIGGPSKGRPGQQ